MRSEREDTQAVYALVQVEPRNYCSIHPQGNTHYDKVDTADTFSGSNSKQQVTGSILR
jgi:hypothetical protein